MLFYMEQEVLINHFSKGDFPQLTLSVIFDRHILRGRRFLAPIAYHQYREAKGPAAMFGVELAPLITDDTVKYLEKHGQAIPKRRTAFSAYLRKAKEVLDQGGIVALAPQAGRRPNLEETATGRPIEALLGRTDNNVVLLPIGFGLRGVKDYADARGYNLFKRYQMQIGRVFTKEELMFAANGDESIDQLVVDLLRQVVPDSYLK